MAIVCCSPRKIIHCCSRLFEGRRLYRRYYFRLLLLLAAFVVYYEINVRITSSLNNYISNEIGRCTNSPEDDEDLYYLLRNTHEILNKYKLDPFLVYGR